jgi:hypothetical protein
MSKFTQCNDNNKTLLFRVRCFLFVTSTGLSTSVRCSLPVSQSPKANRRAGASTPITPESLRSPDLRFASLTAKSAKFTAEFAKKKPHTRPVPTKKKAPSRTSKFVVPCYVAVG